MSKLDLHILTKGPLGTPDPPTLPFRTCTMIRKEKDNEKVVFHNDSAGVSAGVLVITIDRMDVLCDLNGTLLTSNAFTVPVGDHKTFKIHDACPPGAQLKYTAKIGTAALEDPIIIIER